MATSISMISSPSAWPVPGEKWWPWRQLLPLKTRWRYGLIDPDERLPREENKRLIEGEALDRLIAKAYLGGFPDPDEENPHDDDDDDSLLYAEPNPNNEDDLPSEEGPRRDDLTVIPPDADLMPAETETHLLPGPNPYDPPPTPFPVGETGWSPWAGLDPPTLRPP